MPLSPPKRITSELRGRGTPDPFCMKCAACDAPIWIDARTLDFTGVGSWEPSMIVTYVDVAEARCACGTSIHVERHSTDGYGGPTEELIIGGPTDTMRAAARSPDDDE